MIKHNLIASVFIFLLLPFCISCTQSGDQRKFENEAWSLPENFTETNGSGAVIEGNADPDDWRIAPFFQGLVSIDPPFPNPVLTNDRITIYVHIPGIDGVSGLRVLAFRNESSLRPIYTNHQSPLPTGSISVTLDPLEIVQFSENPEAGLYRIIIEDLEENVISYGDIKIN